MARRHAQASVLVDAGGGFVAVFFAAIWEAYPVQEQVWLSTAVITQPAAGQRRPLILDEEGQRLWLDPETPLHALQGLLASEPTVLRERVLANMVNDPKLNGPECLTPA
nr:hypothetical protein GCM10020185_47920 [Pseudomonas brassicacearum subsp. brassicacearum]